MASPRRFERLRHWRTIVGLLAIIALLALVFWDWTSPGDRAGEETYFSHPATWFALHTVTANVVLAAVLAAVAWVYVDHRAARRERIIADSTTSIGLAGTVQPLLGIAFALSWLGSSGPVGRTGATIATLRSASSARSPLKWTREPVHRGDWPESPSRQASGTAAADVVDECIRELVGTVRDWSDLFVASDLGREAAYCMQSLRVQLQELQRCIEHGEPDRGCDMLTDVRSQTLYMAVHFEDASGPAHRRGEIERVLQRPWAAADLRHVARFGSSAAPDTPDEPPDARADRGRAMVHALFEHLEG